MKLRLACALAWLALAPAALADQGGCAGAAAAAGARAGLPSGMLLAIGMVESGWTDPATGRRAPWPYSVDVDGRGYRFPDAAAAAGFTRLARASGARSIDVGCFQVDLEDHPGAFGSLAEAFDPRANAEYAAGFLNRLHARLGSWNAAIAAYHSETAALGLPYERLVLAAWHGGAAPPAPALSPDPYVIHVAAGSGLPRVVTP
ncbi:MAG TPA: transglycosylase SLT domain-containing protein [Acetobacteraceae bacterium]|nr:transglycosylase SLT domain-containing protein [Acetobacteraceae bacterium]